MKVAIYTRVSTTDQNPELQLREMMAYVERSGWVLSGSYHDTMSGAKTKRPELDRLMHDARTRSVDCVLVWKLDRFGRSLIDLVANIQLLESYGVRFIAMTQGIDTDQRNPVSKFLIHILAAAAEFERNIIAERTEAGRRRYQQDYESGTARSRSGKNMAPHRPKRIFDREAVHKLRDQGLTLREIAVELGIGRGTVERTLRSWKAPSVVPKVPTVNRRGKG